METTARSAPEETRETNKVKGEVEGTNHCSLGFGADYDCEVCNAIS